MIKCEQEIRLILQLLSDDFEIPLMEASAELSNQMQELVEVLPRETVASYYGIHLYEVIPNKEYLALEEMKELVDSWIWYIAR